MAVAALTLMSACTSKGGSTGAASSVVVTETMQFVAVGGSESLGEELSDGDRLRFTWTQVLFDNALPRNSVLVNMAGPEATVAAALIDQLPTALSLEPALATVWLTTADAIASTPVTDYRRDLELLVGGLVAAGTRVLLVTASPATSVDTSAYDAAAREVATVTGAEPVDLSTVALGLGVQSHQAVADAFAIVVGDVVVGS